MRFPLLIVLSIVSSFVAGASAGFFGHDSLLRVTQSIGAANEQTARRALHDALIDPDNAEFTNLVVADDGTICGEVNARNRMGGYTGYRRFLFWRSGEVEFDPARESARERQWVRTPSQTEMEEAAQAFERAFARCPNGLGDAPRSPYRESPHFREGPSQWLEDRG